MKEIYEIENYMVVEPNTLRNPYETDEGYSQDYEEEEHDEENYE